jgi:hypothetical protein
VQERQPYPLHPAHSLSARTPRHAPDADVLQARRCHPWADLRPPQVRDACAGCDLLPGVHHMHPAHASSVRMDTRSPSAWALLRSLEEAARGGQTCSASSVRSRCHRNGESPTNGRFRSPLNSNRDAPQSIGHRRCFPSPGVPGVVSRCDVCPKPCSKMRSARPRSPWAVRWTRGPGREAGNAFGAATAGLDL